LSEHETGPQPDVAIKAWIKKSMDDVVQELMDRGVLDSIVAEARPAWMLPFTLLIGQVREHGKTDGFDWFICGDGPTTVANAKVAATPREAARHFALQWQLESARKGGEGSELSLKAGALYELVEDPNLWESSQIS
jgi:hypothetical protein